MTSTHASGDDRRLDFAFGPAPKRHDAIAAFRLSDARRTAGMRGPSRVFVRRTSRPKHLHWRGGVARFHEV